MRSRAIFSIVSEIAGLQMGPKSRAADNNNNHGHDRSSERVPARERQPRAKQGTERGANNLIELAHFRPAAEGAKRAPKRGSSNVLLEVEV